MREADGASRAVNGAKEPKSLTEEDEDGVWNYYFLNSVLHFVFRAKHFLILMFMQFFY